MGEQNQPIDSLKDLRDIRQMMERSSRFISLSGFSGIVAGIFGLVAAWTAQQIIHDYYNEYNGRGGYSGPSFVDLQIKLMGLAAITLIVVLSAAYFFTWRRVRQHNVKMWTMTTRKLLWNLILPLICGGLFILAMLQHSEWRFITPAALIFYGLALVNASKYTLSDIRYLGYFEIVLGLISTQFFGDGLYFWAIGFGVLHIVYGAIMWWKYERGQNLKQAQ